MAWIHVLHCRFYHCFLYCVGKSLPGRLMLVEGFSGILAYKCTKLTASIQTGMKVLRSKIIKNNKRKVYDHSQKIRSFDENERSFIFCSIKNWKYTIFRASTLSSSAISRSWIDRSIFPFVADSVRRTPYLESNGLTFYFRSLGSSRSGSEGLVNRTW